jgi:hypothetical protein
LNQTDRGVYLSINGGNTNLTGFNAPGGGDLADYNANNPNDPFDAFTGSNQAHTFSGVDQTNMDIIGYDLAAVPEPTSIILLGSVLAVVAGVTKRRTALRKEQQLG